jgi:hypothetical protein
LSTASRVYGLPEALEKHCIQAGLFVDKKVEGLKRRGFAHPRLWICRRFSTVGVRQERISTSFVVQDTSFAETRVPADR